MIGGIAARGPYRYRLWRRWGAAAPALFVMLNPSTADAIDDDPTIRRCIGFARRWRCGGIEVVNLYALRATDPRDLRRHPAPIGPQNDAVLAAAIATAGVAIAAWGCHGQDRAARLVELAGARPLHCLAVNRDGSPRHPLYVPAAQRRRRWRA
jgi:hypothetical protein